MPGLRKSRVKMDGPSGMVAGVHCRCLGPRGRVPVRALAIVKRVVRFFAQESEVRHAVHVLVAPAPSLKMPNGFFTFGVFTKPNRRGDRVVIGIAGTMPRQGLAETVMHELVHYEQWRDKRKLQERGVRLRSTALVLKMQGRRRWRSRS